MGLEYPMQIPVPVNDADDLDRADRTVIGIRISPI